ncbi:head-tail connector protein [uncultured Tateyamaria sp.]|uniref:head-tail connector protein n=1 Tax=Tateyamaria sp. 1078 TaxID=3417464 RepID=UPI00263A194E|nr:head-tail connector protein [uncultured Tateyamaria sp.]
MSQLIPADVKPQCNVALNHNGDDVLLQSYIDAAEAHVVRYVRRDLDSEFPSGWPADILQAVRLLVAHYYRFREAAVIAATASEVPMGVKALLEPHRNFCE